MALIPVRLTEIPLEVRCAAARREGAEATDEERASLLVVALFPSEKIYWIRGEAYDEARAAA